jgi:CheY-like chemotaxis protein
VLNGVKILIAEDNLLNQRVLKHILEQKHATMQFVQTGKQAVDKLEAEHFDVILMDLHMPEMDGFAATKYIRETMRSNIPIIAITAGSFANENETCLAAGMNACVYKPFESDSLGTLILNTVKNSISH